ncbi:MAG: 4-vinyl reductase [Firmicutes bacterium]|nr:4-vinyl reductase [Bacillota bacterium]
MKENDISRKVINYMYMSICKTMNQVPFSGRHWLEQFVLGVAQYLIDEYWDKLEFTPENPLDTCRAYLSLLDGEGFLDTGDYRLEESEDDLLLTIERDKCVYREYSLRAQEEGLPFYCVRLGTLQAVLRHVLGANYSASVEIDEKGICHGRLFPAARPKEEIVTRDGHILKIAGRRAVLLPQETYASLIMSVREHAPHALKHVLYDAGYQSGLSLARKTRALYPKPEECLQLLLEEIKNEGLGNVELVSFNLPRARARIRCYGSFQVAAADEYGNLYRTSKVICDLLRGVFAAYLSVLFDKEIICEEMSCQSMGGNYCEFHALPLPKKQVGRRGPRDRKNE